MIDPLRHYREVWLVDFEFRAPDGERPEPICMVAREWRSGRTIRVWADKLANMAHPPFPIGNDSLFVAYYASAEFGCFLALGWPMPARVLDLFCEFRNFTNGGPTVAGNGLLGALAFFGLGGIDAADKRDMRELAQRRGPHNETERAALLAYCESDVLALAKLLPAMLPKIDIPRALLRGRYMIAASAMEWNGIPIDVKSLARLRANWEIVQHRLVARVNEGYGVYVPVVQTVRTTSTASGEVLQAAGGTLPPVHMTFSRQRWAEWLVENVIPWPRLESGALNLSDDAFRQMARQYPAVAPIRELRHTLSQMRLNELAVGSDGRNRCLLSAFRARTGRNQPSNSRFIFGPSCWLRGLIQPQEGRAVVYVDWEQQEFGIAAALSGDRAMMEAYASGDPYLTFAKQAGAVPPEATKQTHPKERNQFKICALAVQYGMGSQSLAQSLGVSETEGRELLRLHRKTYPDFWRWSEAAVDYAMLRGRLYTVFGWQIQAGSESNPRSLANFPAQANGAEMLRLACCLATERKIMVCAPVHDALLVEGTTEAIEAVVAEAQKAMADASRIILDGFALRTEAKIVRWPDRYMDERGAKMWDTVLAILDELQAEAVG